MTDGGKLRHPWQTWGEHVSRRIHPRTRKVFADTWFLVRSKDLSTKAGALTSALSLSFVPLLAIAFTFFKLFGGLQDFLDDTLEPLILEHFSENAGPQIVGYLTHFVENMNVNAMSAVSFVTLLATTISLLFTIETAFNDIYGVRVPRTFLQRLVNYWVMLTLTPLVIVFSTAKFGGLFTAFDFAKGFLESYGVMHFIRWFIGFLSQSLGFGLLFFLLPHRKLPWRAVIAAGVFTSILFDVLQYLNIYLTKRAFADTTITAIYGSVALIPVIFFYWVKLIFYILLTGACLSIAIARQIGAGKKDQTLSHPGDQVFLAAKVLALLVDQYRKGGMGLSDEQLSHLLAEPSSLVGSLLLWLRRQGFVAALERPSDHVLTYLPTHQGNKVTNNAEEFLSLCFENAFKKNKSDTSEGNNITQEALLQRLNLIFTPTP